MVDALNPHDRPPSSASSASCWRSSSTPDAYPLTLNALTNGCNQTSNREPVVQYEPYQVETAALALKSQGLVRVVHPGSGERATKYRQVADEALRLAAARAGTRLRATGPSQPPDRVRAEDPERASPPVQLDNGG